MKKMEMKFGECMQDVWSHKTSVMPKCLIVRPVVDNEKISTKDQWDYRLGAGILLYHVRHLPPNLANATRELSRANNGANPAAYKELLCVIKYVLDTNNFGLKIEPMGNSNKQWEIICFGNNDYAGDLVSRRSISGIILFVLGVPASWPSK